VDVATTDDTIRLARGTYERLQAEAERRHRAIDEIADALLDEQPPRPAVDRE
jgi:hypothetical protein